MTKKESTAASTTGLDKVLGEFVPTKQNVDVVFKLDNQKDYAEPTITFDDIKGYSINGPFLIIQEHDDTQYVLPMDSVASLKLSTTKE